VDHNTSALLEFSVTKPVPSKRRTLYTAQEQAGRNQIEKNKAIALAKRIREKEEGASPLHRLQCASRKLPKIFKKLLISQPEKMNWKWRNGHIKFENLGNTLKNRSRMVM
jgi:hypothetical protein